MVSLERVFSGVQTNCLRIHIQKALLLRHLGTNKGNVLFTHSLLRHLSPRKVMAFPESHFWISQYGKLGKGFLWCWNNFSRSSPTFDLVTMVSLNRISCGVQTISLGLHLGIQALPSLPIRIKKSSIETFGNQQGKYSFYTCSIETLKSQQGDGFFRIPCLN